MSENKRNLYLMMQTRIHINLVINKKIQNQINRPFKPHEHQSHGHVDV